MNTKTSENTKNSSSSNSSDFCVSHILNFHLGEASDEVTARPVTTPEAALATPDS